MSAADELQRLGREIGAAERQQRHPPGDPQSATALQNGLTGAAAGLLAGYAVARLRR